MQMNDMGIEIRISGFGCAVQLTLGWYSLPCAWGRPHPYLSFGFGAMPPDWILSVAENAMDLLFLRAFRLRFASEARHCS